ncbi:MAG: AAA-like domain-containing protein [Cyanobacteria bacterium SBC]|nr:AAA-like domain-containing protein [Cyanobacteria bacterium SBC]
MFDPYQVGGSLVANAPTYIERPSDKQLFEALERGEFCYVLNCRQMGKSSLLVQTRYHLEQKGFHCVTIDLTQLGSERVTPLQWYKGFVTELWRGLGLVGELNLKAWWQDVEDLSLVQRLSQFFECLLHWPSIDRRLFVFVDEIDSVLSLPFSVDDFFAVVRYCYNQRTIDPAYNRLAFAIFGVATPSDLIGDRKRTPFNIGTAIDLSCFAVETLSPLEVGLNLGRGNAKAVLREIFYWTNGQPFLTQKLCQIVRKQLLFADAEVEANGRDPRPGHEAAWVAEIVDRYIVRHWETQDEPEHLKTIRNRLLHDGNRAGVLLGLYQKLLQGETIRRNDSRAHMELLLSGLVLDRRGWLEIKTPIYRSVFDLDWVARQLSTLRPYSEALDAWIASQKIDDSRLLRGQALRDARTWASDKSLSDCDYQFLAASVDRDRRETERRLEAERMAAIEEKLAAERLNAKRQKMFNFTLSGALVVSIGLGITALRQSDRAFQSEQGARVREIQALVASSDGLFASHQRLDATLAAIKASHQFECIDRVGRESCPAELKAEIDRVLRQAIFSTQETNRLEGHRGWVLVVKASPDGQTIATGSNDRTVKLWQPDGTLLNTLPHSDTVHGLNFSPDSQTLVTSSLDGNIYLWTRDGRLLHQFRGHDSAIWDLAFSPDGTQIASAGGDGTVRLWNRNGDRLATLSESETAVWGVSFDLQGRSIVANYRSGSIVIWNADGTLEQTFTPHTGAVWDLEIARLEIDGNRETIVASASGDGTVKLSRLDGTLLKTLEGHEAEVFEVAVSPAGDAIAASGGDRTVRVWRPDGTLLSVLRGHRSAIRGLAFVPDTSLLISASDDNTAHLWKLDNPFTKVLQGHDRTIWDVDFSPDGQQILTTGDTAKVWSRDGRLLTSVADILRLRESVFVDKAHFQAPLQARVARGTPREQQLFFFSASRLGQISLWNADGTLFGEFDGHTGGVWDTTLSPDGRLLVSAGDDNTIKLWDLDGTLRHVLHDHRSRVYDVDFSPDGTYLGSVSEDGDLKFWTLDGQLLSSTASHDNGVWELAFSPDGRSIATASLDDTVKFWTPEGEHLQTLTGHNGGMTSVEFSPDGQFVVGGGAFGRLQLWRSDGTELMTLAAHDSVVWDVAFSPDSRSIVSGGDDRTAILWDWEKIQQTDPLEYACDLVRDYLATNPNLTEDERHLCDDVK